MKNRTIYIDMDDTLIDTQLLYNEVNARCLDYVVSASGKSREVIEQKHHEIDIANVAVLGFSKERFPKSWCDTYAFFVGGYAKELEEKAKEVFQLQSPVIEGVEEVLRVLSERGNRLILLTAGDEEVQRSRIETFPYRTYFEEIIIVPMKNKETMQNVVEHPEKSIMIGNSLKSDIFPALENGMKAIHVERGSWLYDHHAVDTTNPDYYHLHDIRGVLTIEL